MRQLAPVTPPVGFLSNCQGSLGDLRGLFDSYWIAAQVASAASAVAAGFPSSLTFLPGLIIVAVIFGVANGLAISFAKDLSLSQDCAVAAALHWTLVQITNAADFGFQRSMLIGRKP